jgi:predicted secreted hydrolase
MPFDSINMGRILGFLVFVSVLVAALILLARTPESSNELSAQVLSAEVPVEGFAFADGSQMLVFPRDFGPHEDFQTEWWYYTGNLDNADGRHFGYELTFFRVSMLPPDQVPPRDSDWAADDIYMAHFALTDVDGGEFYAFQRYARGAMELAGAESQPYHVWLEDWDVQETGAGSYLLAASNEGLRLSLRLQDEKGPILQGLDGYSRKGADANNASYYYSQTRLITNGEIQIGDEEFEVSGLSWKDHEYSTNALRADQVGWDWFSIQLDDGYEIMLYQIRRTDGSIDPFSSGTLIAPDSSTRQLERDDFEIVSSGTWRSPHSEAEYPMGWTIRIRETDLELKLTPYLKDQELNLSTIYWEGAVQITGKHNGQAVTGVGYVEMTGYAEPLGPGL